VTIARTGVEAAATGTQHVDASKARIAAAFADIDRARTAVEQARLDVERTTVRAPVGGIVSRKSIEKGAVIQAGQPLMAIVPLDNVWVTANFKETQLERIRLGQEAEVQVDAYGAHTFKARVDSIASATGATFSLLPAENASGNFVKVVQRVPVKLVITDKPGDGMTLRPGMSAEVSVIAAKGK